ncbi:MAG: glycosyltransferase family 4 protein [Candidatus Moraniibacteriota bacterium]
MKTSEFLKKKAKATLYWLDSITFKSRFSFESEYFEWKRFSLGASKSKDSDFVDDRHIYFLIPGTRISGGIAIVFQHANRLLRKKYKVKILSLNNSNDFRWFSGQSVEVLPFRITKKILKSHRMDVLVATGYSTAFSVAMSQAKRKLYFVQSDESRFFPEEKKKTELILSTYSLPMEYVTEARWIQAWLKREFGHESRYVPNGLDADIFFKSEPIGSRCSKQRVLIEGAINVPYKGMDDSYAVVSDLDVEVWIISNNGQPKKDWRFDRYFEDVPYGEMNRIYSSCDIFLKMSRVEGFFGPPMEAMACGCAVVVGKVTGYDEYIIDGYNALVVEQGDVASAKKAVERLMNDSSLREKLIANGYKTAKEWDWNRSVDLLEAVLANKPNGEPESHQDDLIDCQ